MKHQFTVRKKVEDLQSGKKVQREAKVTLDLFSIADLEQKERGFRVTEWNDPETAFQTAVERIGLPTLMKWVDYGRLVFSQRLASQKLAGSVGDRKLARRLTDLREKVLFTMELLECNYEQALQTVLQKKAYSDLAPLIQQTQDQSVELTIDETTEPAWFRGEEEEEQGEDEA